MVWGWGNDEVYFFPQQSVNENISQPSFSHREAISNTRKLEAIHKKNYEKKMNIFLGLKIKFWFASPEFKKQESCRK